MAELIFNKIYVPLTVTDLLSGSHLSRDQEGFGALLTFLLNHSNPLILQCGVMF